MMLSTGFILTLLVLVTFERSDAAANRSFVVDKATQMFMKDGQPFRYVSGGMHYFRVPHEYWRDRLHKLRAMGANAVETYIEWSLHEPRPLEYNFEGDADVLQFIKLAQEEDLVVIIRAGPYICAERNMGGFPYWLTQGNKNMKIRVHDDEVYMTLVRRWMTRLLTMLKPYLYSNGGPIIMIQVENEYGLFACDAVYMQQLTELFDQVLGKDKVIYFTTDPAHALKCGHTEKALATVDFGTGADAASCFNTQREIDPNTPYINSEFYPGWLDHWTKPHEKVSSDKVVRKLNEMLSFANNSNVNVYMYHGGTSFGFGNGANSGEYLPNPTSYDYDSPVSEAGDLTDKYFAMRDVIISYLGDPHIEVPARVQPKLVIPSIKLNRVAGSLMDVVSKERKSINANPMTFEDLDQPNGFVIYSHQVALPISQEPSEISAPGLRDRAIVYCNGVKVGVLSVMAKKTSIKLTVKTGDHLVFVVEDMGRVNFGNGITEYKGLGDRVTLNGQDLIRWSHQKVPLNSPSFYNETLSLPTITPSASLDTNVTALYRGQFTLQETPKDTFVHLPGWKKGVVLVNGFNLGRYWPSIGPQQSLYLPGCKLLPGPSVNEILILELESAPCSSPDTCIVQFLDNHIIDGPVKPDDA